MPASQAAILTPSTTGISGKRVGANGEGFTVDLAMKLLLVPSLADYLAITSGVAAVFWLYSKAAPVLKCVSAPQKGPPLPNCHAPVTHPQSGGRRDGRPGASFVDNKGTGPYFSKGPAGPASSKHFL